MTEASPVAPVAPFGARLRDVAQRVGPVGWAGAALLGLAALAAVFVLPRVGAANAELRERIAVLEQRVAAPPLLDRARAMRERGDVAGALVEQLPPAGQVASFIALLQSRAQRLGVQVDRTEYRVESVLGGRATRTQVVLPAHATYPQLRGWIEAVLHEVPSAGVDELSMRRESDGSAQLEVRVVVSYYTRSAGAAR